MPPCAVPTPARTGECCRAVLRLGQIRDDPFSGMLAAVVLGLLAEGWSDLSNSGDSIGRCTD
jgi:hypothetical protein